jgi:sulfate adenylyltransferase subunit 1 (EFTu-like GTPase family)
MFKVGKVISYYEKIGITVVELSGNLTVGDTILVYKDGEEVLKQYVDQIVMDQKKIPFAKHGDVVALVLNDKVQKGSEVYRQGGVV